MYTNLQQSIMENTKNTKSKILLSLTGPSGSGKSEILSKLCETGKFKRLISTTTRHPRSGEVDGKDYNFTSEAIFNRLLDQSQFIQHIRFQGNFYGTLKADAEDMLSSGAIPVVIVEPSGVEQFRVFGREYGYKIFSVYVTADNVILLERYLARMASLDLDNQDLRMYHAKRIQAIHNEWSTWKEAEDYDLSLINSSQNKSNITTLVEVITESLKKHD